MVISRVIIRVTPFRALITLLITYLLSPLPLQVPGFISSCVLQASMGFCQSSGRSGQGFTVSGSGFRVQVWFRVSGSGFSLGFRVSGSGFRV